MARDIESLLRQQAALAAFGTFAFQETDLAKILNEAARICAESLNVPHCKVCRYRSVENDLLIEAGFGWNAGVVGKVVSQADESSPQGRAFVTGKPVIVRNLQAANGYQPPDFYRDHGIVSTVDVLIKSHNGPSFGVLEVDSTAEQTYDQHDIDFLTGFANVLAEAVATGVRDETLRATLAEMTNLVAEKQRLLEERDLLAREMQHRVRNNLQLVNNMLSDQLKETTDDDARDGIRAIIQRVMSLAEVYEHLLGAGLTGQIDFGAYALALCENLPDLQPVLAFPVTLNCAPEPLLVSLATATSLGLVLTELISNSYEHAFPSRGGGIQVRFGHDAQNDDGVIMISDDGIGYSGSGGTSRRGVGLARRLMLQIDGRLDVVRSSGTTWTLRFPVLAHTDIAAAAI